MAKLQPGVIGTLSGKIDNVIASNWRDIRYLRGLAKTGGKEPTEAQLTQRAKFTLIFDFLSTFASIAEMGFQYQYTGKSTAFNLAMSANMAAAGGTAPDVTINYPAVTISKGRLTPTPDASVNSTSAGVVTITWPSLDTVSDQELSDHAVVVIYNPAKKIAVYSANGAVRSDLKIDLHVPASFSGDEVHAWLFFSSDKAKKNSATKYAGSIMVY